MGARTGIHILRMAGVVVVYLHLGNQRLIALQLLLRRQSARARGLHVAVGHGILVVGIRSTTLSIGVSKALHIRMVGHGGTWPHLRLWDALCSDLRYRKMAIAGDRGKRRSALLRQLPVDVGRRLTVSLHLRLLGRHARAPRPLLHGHAIRRALLLSLSSHLELPLLRFHDLSTVLPLHLLEVQFPIMPTLAPFLRGQYRPNLLRIVVTLRLALSSGTLCCESIYVSKCHVNDTQFQRIVPSACL